MGRVIAKRGLQRHPATASPDISIATKALLVGSDVLRVEYHMRGELSAVSIPPTGMEGRADRLWEHTCFEAFLGMSDGAYAEVNVAPSTLWATYDFDGYRSGMRRSSVSVLPHVVIAEECLSVTASIDLRSLPAVPVRLGLSAVVEALDGSKSYWALAHPPGAPDFHHADCFALELAAPAAS